MSENTAIACLVVYIASFVYVITTTVVTNKSNAVNVTVKIILAIIAPVTIWCMVYQTYLRPIFRAK